MAKQNPDLGIDEKGAEAIAKAIAGIKDSAFEASESFAKIRDFAKEISKGVAPTAQIANSFKEMRDFSKEVENGFKNITSAMKLKGEMEGVTYELSNANDLMNTFQLRSMSAAFAAKELADAESFGLSITGKRRKELNVEMEKYNNTQKSIASDSILNQSVINGLEKQMTGHAEDALEIKKLMVEVDAKYLLQKRKEWANASQTLEQLQAQTAEDFKSVNLADARLDIMAQYINSKKEIEKIEENIRVLTNAGMDTTSKEVELMGQRERFEKTILDYKATGSEIDGKDIANQLAGLKRERADSYQRQIAGTIVLAEQQEKQTVKQILNQKILGGYSQHLNRTEDARLGTLGEHVNKVKGFLNYSKLVPKPYMILDFILKSGYDRFIALDKAAEDFRKETGFSNTQMVELRKNVEAVNVEFASMGVSAEVAYKSASALADTFGRTSLVSKEALQNVSLLSVNLGVAQENSAAVLATFQGLGGASEQAAMNIIKVGAGISEKAGVSFKLVMQDVANASEDTLAAIGANPSKLMKSAIAARAMGMELNKLVSSQNKLLDFSTSINDEMEASALLGKNVNFQLARQLAFEGRVEDAAKATLETVKSAGDFNKMNKYQREALAKASGMELKDLTKMMAVEAQRDAILKGSDEGKKATLKAQEKELANLKKINDLDSEDLVKQNEKALMQQKMQGLLTKFKNIMDSISVAFADILEPIITPLIGILIPAFKLIGMLARTFSFILKGLIFPITYLVEKLGLGVEKLDGATSSFSGFSEKVKTLFAWVLGIGGSILTIALVGKAGWIGLGNGIKTIFSTIGSGLASLTKADTWKTLWGGMQSGFKASMDFIKGAWNKENPIGGMTDSAKSGFGKLKDKFSFGKKTADVSSDASKTAVEGAKSATDIAKTSDTVKPKAGEGIKTFFKNLAAGLKAMAGMEVLKGALNLIPASIGLVVMIPGVIGAKLLSMVDGEKLSTALEGMAKGFKKMSGVDVLLGALNLIPASIGLVLMIPGVVGAKLLSMIDGDAVKEALGGIASGLKKMASPDVLLGAGSLILASAAFAIMTVGAIGLAAVAFLGEAAGAGLTGLSVGLAALGANPAAWLGILAVGALVAVGVVALAALVGAFALFSSSLKEFTNLKWEDLAKAGVAIVGFGLSVAGLGLIAPFIASGAMALAVLGVALAVFGAGVTVLVSMMPALTEGIEKMIAPLNTLGGIAGGLFVAAGGIAAIGVALAAFGAGSAVAGIGNFIGGFLGGDPIDKLKELSSMGSQLQLTADSIQKISNSMSNFGAVDAFALSVDKLTLSLSKLNSQVENMSVIKLAALSVISAAAPTAAPATEAAAADNGSGAIGGKLDELISLMRSGGIAVNLDGRKVSSAMASSGRD